VLEHPYSSKVGDVRFTTLTMDRLFLDIGEIKPRGRGRPRLRDAKGNEICPACRQRENERKLVIDEAINTIRNAATAGIRTTDLWRGEESMRERVIAYLSSLKASPVKNPSDAVDFIKG
jgi:hypothetical protein